MDSLTRLDLDGPVARLWLTRPDKRNALKRQTLEQLLAHLERLGNEPECRVLVLGCEGEVFCAGMDLGEMQQRAASPHSATEWHRDSEVYRDVLARLYALPIPTIAAVSGPALAGGVGLVLGCDLVVASRQAYFMLPEPMRGITAAMVTPLLVHRVGAGAATGLLLSGEKWTADRAYTLGLCHDITEPAEFASRIEHLVQAVLSGSRQALAITKRHLDQMVGAQMANLLHASMSISAEARQTSDAREGLQAFLEKRKPNWQPFDQP
jgi:methylglutaconyl-CoA hydratase